MPTPPKPNPTHPAAPAARKTPGTAETPETTEQDPRPDEDFDEIDLAAQPEAEDGVPEDMGTLALHPGSFEVEGRPSGRLVESPL
jgi:hypothetical protein